MFESLDKIKFLIVALNLLILYFLLKRTLFKPVTQHMENRTKMIRDSIDNAEKAKADAAELKKKYEDQLRTAKDEADKILNEARSRANKEYEEILQAAKKDAEGTMLKAREEIERERIQMLKDVRSEVASLALAAASKVIEANMDTESNKVLVNKFIDEAGVA
ncbi:MAG: F0F1 ATP synthase subunit B [Clostridia bacterium]|nr:F0F1 ATP synthase subunit B [Clostridia bacterium]